MTIRATFIIGCHSNIHSRYSPQEATDLNIVTNTFDDAGTYLEMYNLMS